MIKHVAFFKKFILFITPLCKNVMKIYEANVNGFYKKFISIEYAHLFLFFLFNSNQKSYFTNPDKCRPPVQKLF